MSPSTDQAGSVGTLPELDTALDPLFSPFARSDGPGLLVGVAVTSNGGEARRRIGD